MRYELSGREWLRQWMQRRQLNGLETSRLIGVHPTQLSQILSGGRRPGLNNAVKIERATGIPVEAWMATSVDIRADKTVGAAT